MNRGHMFAQAHQLHPVTFSDDVPWSNGQNLRIDRDLYTHLLTDSHFYIYIYVYIGWMTITHIYLIGGLENFLFFHILGILISTDSYFSEG